MTISGKTRLFAVVGNPLDHSFSPLIHNYLFEYFDIDAVYVALPVELDAFLPLMEALASTSFDGVNITTPHKTGLVGNASFVRLTDEADELSAVNTLQRVGKQWMGYNTDGAGLCDFIEIDCNTSISGCEVTVLGAGPAARAAVLEIIKRNGRVSVLNRSEERFNHPFWQKTERTTRIVTAAAAMESKCEEILAKADIIINATVFGQNDNGKLSSFPWAFDSFLPSLVVDMNYGKENVTPFLDLFKTANNCFSGRGMLRRQACLAFTIWTGFEVDEEVQKALALYIGSY